MNFHRKFPDYFGHTVNAKRPLFAWRGSFYFLWTKSTDHRYVIFSLISSENTAWHFILIFSIFECLETHASNYALTVSIFNIPGWFFTLGHHGLRSWRSTSISIPSPGFRFTIVSQIKVNLIFEDRDLHNLYILRFMWKLSFNDVMGLIVQLDILYETHIKLFIWTDFEYLVSHHKFSDLTLR